MRKYIASHWRGEQSLERSYWLNGVVFGIPLKILGAILEAVDPSQTGVEAYFALSLLYFGAVVPWGIWFAVGVFRSGAAHIRRTGRKFWARVAQFIAGVNLLLMPIIIYSGVVVTWNFGLAVLGKDDFVAATLQVNENGVLVLEGHILFDTPDQFRLILSENPDVEIVQLESRGGYAEPAQKMAQMIKDRELETYTSYQCSSACTFMYISGSKRYLDFDGVLGFHQSGLDGVPDSAVAALYPQPEDLFLGRGVPQSFLDRVQAVSSDDIWNPTLLELVEANIVTHVYEYNEKTTYAAADYCAAMDCAGPAPADPDEDSTF